uniref:Outer membrane protein assembly factor n=1 Tax=Siphoviridae sp. ctDXu9 TaxID=2825387 RepID=A0A8S5VCL3_9CAUD|nr:MAG TPA: outer membrane protein assembly factor [Siphoviridae sp. ctDXu9]
MKKKLFTAIITLATITLTSCQSVPASETEKIFTDGYEITSIETTETGALYTFTDGTGYDQEESGNEIPQLSNVNGLYPLTGIVTEIKYDIEPEVDLVTITCSNGNMFSWYTDTGDYEINDLASCIMDSKGTKYVTDDEVLLAHYAGGLKHFEQYKN